MTLVTNGICVLESPEIKQSLNEILDEGKLKEEITIVSQILEHSWLFYAAATIPGSSSL